MKKNFHFAALFSLVAVLVVAFQISSVRAARLDTIGFELATTTANIEVTNNTFCTTVGSGALSIQSTVVNSGVYAEKQTPSSGNGCADYQFATGASTTYARAFFRWDSLPTATDTFLVIGNATNKILGGAFMNAAGKIGAIDFVGSTPTYGTTLSSAITTGTWHYVEVFVSTASANSQTVTVRLDGTQIDSKTGSETQAANGDTLLEWGSFINTTSSEKGSLTAYVDDIAINNNVGSTQNSWPGPGFDILYLPSGAGDANAWLKSSGSAGDANNYTQVDENPTNNGSTYLKANSLGATDFYAVSGQSSLPSNSNINLLQVGVRYAGSSVASMPQFKLEAEKVSNGTIASGTAITPVSTSWQSNANAAPFNSPLTLYNDPDGSAWINSTIGSMQIGESTVLSNTNYDEVSTIWAYVEFVPPPVPNPMTFSTAPYGASTSSISMTATTATVSSTPPVSYLFTYSSSCSGDNGTGGASSTWQASTVYTNSGLQVNQCYAYTVTAEGSASPANVGSPSAVATAYTLANVPGAPTLSSPTASTLTLTNASSGNPSNTLFAIQATSSSPSDANWNGKWVTVSGTATSSPVWLTNTQLTGLVVQSLQASTTYSFTAEAENGNGVATAQGPVGQGTTSAANLPPNTPTESAPTNGIQDVPTLPVFQVTATDPNGDNIEYRVVLYTDNACTATSTVYDETSSETGWSGQNATSSSPGDSYLSGTQGVYTAQVALSQSQAYYWQASAIDPLGSDTWGSFGSCKSFTTTSGLWTTDSGSWSVSSSQLVVMPPAGTTVQIHVNPSLTLPSMGVIEFQAKSNESSGAIAGIFRADSGSNRYQLMIGDFLNQKSSIGKTVSGAYTTLATVSQTLVSGTLYDFRGYIASSSPSTIKAWVNGANMLSTTDSAGVLQGVGYVGIIASSTDGTTVFSIDDVAIYSSTTISFTNLPGGGSWSILLHDGTKLSIGGVSCWTTGTVDLSTYTGQVPIDYNNGGGQVAVWATNNSCTGTPAATYPSAGLAQDIFGGDIYSFSANSTNYLQGTGVGQATSTITVGSDGLISY